MAYDGAPGNLGCYEDCHGFWGCNNRALPIGPVDSDHQSVEWCFKHCLDELTPSNKYAGLEYEHQCFCGNNENYGRFGKKADSECQATCTGNSDQICGGDSRISIYRISQGVCSNHIGPPTNGDHAITNPRSLSYNLNNFKFFGTRVDFSCDPGYTLHGASSIECTETGNNNVAWSQLVPTCEVPTTTANTRLSNYTTPKSTTPSQTRTTTSTRSSNTFQSLTGYTTDVGTGNNQTTGDLQTRTTERTSTNIIPPTWESTWAPDHGRNSPIAGKLGTGEVAGIAVGALVALTVLIVAVVFLWRKRSRKPKEQKEPDIALDTVGAHYLNHTFANHLSDTSDTAQNQGDRDSAPPVYSQVVKRRPAAADESATLSVPPQNDQDGDSGWVDNEVYGCQSFPIEIEARNKDRDGRPNDQPPMTMEGKPGWVENIIYE
ncbi:cell wall integrity and stress response component 2-like [Patiria miniata]|uniref:Uncharacterized protein n=1 Tax=Patiria miniata TaxID=46514 RepID=A0A913ZX18_PATMI|nr:cell wall integrity and stress response component 2-like [Patiria miniata]